MADPKRPSLTVLGGSMAGTRFVIEESQESAVLGSDESCDFRLPLPGVADVHARLLVDGNSVTIHDAGSGSGLHVNDNPVLDNGAPLRNGDIVWLGTPGEQDVVMLQCILPRTGSTIAPPEALEDEPGEDETLALGPEALFSSEAASAEQATEIMEVGAEPTVAIPAEPATEILDIAREAMGGFTHEDRDLAVEDETAAMPPPSDSEEPATTIMAPMDFEDETVATSSPSLSFPEEPSGAIVVDANEVDSPPVVDAGEEPTVFYSPSEREPEPTMAMPPLEPAPAYNPPKATALPKPEAPPKLAPPPRPTPPAPRAEPAPRPAVRPTPAPRPAPKPRPSTEAPAGRPASSGSPMGLYIAIGVGALAVIGGGAWGAIHYLGSSPKTAATPVPVAQSTPIPPPISTLGAEPTPLPETTLPPVAATPPPVAVATPPPVAATPVPAATPTPRPSATPSPSPKKGAPTPLPTTAAPSAESLRAAQVAGLLGQADAALAARQYDAAVGHLDEVLRLDPGNAKATAQRASAVAQRDAARKKFVPGRTVVKTEKASGGLAGFDSGDVALQRSPDFLGRIDFEMSPASGIRPGDSYTLKFFLINEGKKAIRVQGVTATTNVNGAPSGAPVTPRVREIAPQQRADLGEVTGSWQDGTTSWSAEVMVTANKGDSLKNTISWR